MIKGLICLIPLRGGKVEAWKQGNKYFPVEKAWCLKPTFDKRDHISTSWEVKVDGLLWTCLLLMPEGLGGLKMFSLENEKTKDYFFCFSKAKKRKLKGGTPKQKLKNNWSSFHLLEKEYWILILWRMPRSRRDQWNSNCDQSLFSFLLSKYFSKFIDLGKD